MISNEALFPPGATVRDWAVDGTLAVSATLLSVVPYISWVGDPVFGVIALLSAAMTMPLILRRRSPLLALALCTMAGIGQLIFLSLPTPSLFAVPVVSYSVARWVPGLWSRSVLIVGTFASVLGPMRWFGPSSESPASDIMFWGACFGAVLTPYAIGRRGREVAEARARRLQAAEERYQLLLAEREQQAKLAEASARTMIARELHDIVAHSLSVIIVQAEGGRAAATRKPEVAAQALDTIAETGREALDEMRRIVGVLRSDPGPADKPDYAPTPTLRDLPELVTRTSDRAQLVIEGDPYPVPPALALTIYRVVQEALTNFLKYAGPKSHATATLTYAPTRIVVDIVDDGTGVSDTADGGGNGLRGMYERVISMGGTLRAGPRTDARGFRVTVTLPGRESSPSAPHRRSVSWQ